MCTPYGYNATWWFMSCIILLYLIYPFLYRFRKYWLVLLPLSIYLDSFVCVLPLFHACSGYITAFVVGMLMTEVNITSQTMNNVSKITLIVLFLLICNYRRQFYSAALWDVAIMLTAISIYKTVGLPRQLIHILEFFGKHSANLFMFHTFIYLYYLHDVVYWSNNPIFIYITLLAICIPISMAIEKIKEVI